MTSVLLLALSLSTTPPDGNGLELRRAGAVTLASLAAIGSSTLWTAGTLVLPGQCIRATDRGQPLCSAAGLIVGGGLQILFSWLVLPEVFRLTGADPALVRAEWWAVARWPAAVLAVGAVIYAVAAGFEQRTFDSAQGPMVGALATSGLTSVTFDVLGVIAAVRAAK